MAEELKHLIEQIQKEGVEKANEQADGILSQAKSKAAKIIDEAEAKAKETQQKAEIQAQAFAERSTQTLKQAARDLLITVGQGCEKVITEVLGTEVNSALSGELLKKMITSITEQGKGSTELTVSESDKADLTSFCAGLAKKSGKTIDLASDSEILSGFKIAFKDKNVYLDYTGEALAEALAAFLRPELAKTVSAVAREQVSK